jgi:hypothetical protein
VLGQPSIDVDHVDPVVFTTSSLACLTVRHDFALSFDGLPHREERLPVILHIHDGPTLRRRLVERFVELTDV